MKTILVLTDFSSAAKAAAETALKVAVGFEAEVLLFHSYALPVISTAKNIENDYTKLDEESLDKLQQEKNRITGSDYYKQLLKKPRLSFVNSIRPLADNLYELQEAKDIILVVMGERKDTRNSFLFGNHIHVAMRNSKCPLLVITRKGFDPEGVVTNFACDFEMDDLPMASFLSQLADKFSARVLITHVSTPTILVPDFREQDKLSPFTKNFGLLKLENCQLKYLVSYDLVEEIELFNNSSKVDLLILTNKEHNLFWNLFNAKASKAFIKGQHLPMLILPDQLSPTCIKLVKKNSTKMANTLITKM